MDFAENMEAVVQEEVAPGFFRRSHISLFIAVLYRRKDNVLRHQSYAIVSDDLKHDLHYVLLALNTIFSGRSSAKENSTLMLAGVKKIHYFSDGARQHFKSKNSLWYLAHHSELFGVPGTWTFSASGHGKGACDGVGGVLKVALRRYALNENKTDSSAKRIVTTAASVVRWDKERKVQTKTSIGLIDKDRLERFRESFKDRIRSSARVIQNISAYHFFAGTIPGEVNCHYTSQSPTDIIHRVDSEDSSSLLSALQTALREIS